MLHNLDWIAEGMSWPPTDPDEKARRAEHARNRDLYNVAHEKIFPRLGKYLQDTAKVPIMLGWAGDATQKILNLLTGESPTIVGLADQDGLLQAIDEAAIDMSRYGIGLIQVLDGAISAVNPENWIPVIEQGNIRKISSHVIWYSWKDGSESFVKMAIHSAGKIENRLYKLKETSPFMGSLGERIPLEGDVFETGIDRPLVFTANNLLTSERYYGKSDYGPNVYGLIEAIDLAFSRRDHILAAHAKPTWIVPESACMYDHALQQWTYKPGSAVVLGEGDQHPSMLTWDAQLEAVEKAIDGTMDQLMYALDLSRVLLAGKEAGTAESGTALQVRLIPTMAKVRRFRSAFNRIVPAVVESYTTLEGDPVDASAVSVQWKDGIPRDPVQTAQVISLLVSSGAMSIRRALVEQGLSGDALEQELAELSGKGVKVPEGGPTISLPEVET